MAEDREAVRAALAQAEDLVDLADMILTVDQRHQEVLAAAVQRCLVPLPAPSGGSVKSPFAGTSALGLTEGNRPSQVMRVVAEQVQTAPPVRAQVSLATSIKLRLGGAAVAARPAARGAIRGLFTSRSAREKANVAYVRLVDLLEAAEKRGAGPGFARALSAADSGASAAPNAEITCRAAAQFLGLPLPEAGAVLLTAAELDVTRRFLAAAPAMLRERDPLITDVKTSFAAAQDRMVGKQLRDMPVAALKQATGGRVRFKSLGAAGCETVEDVLRAGSNALAQVNGVSEVTARQLVAAAEQVRRAAKEDLRVRIDLDRTDVVITRLVTALYLLRRHDRLLEGHGDQISAALELLRPLSAVPASMTSLAVLGPEGTSVALVEVRRVLAELTAQRILALLAKVRPNPRSRPTSDEVWDDFERDGAGYYTTLTHVMDLELDDDAAAGNLPAEIVQAVQAQGLDETLLQGRVSLRGYQTFGARYALVQRRTLLGDEMGLGKTVQAIAVMAHLTSGGARHHLVVCPASVLVNWTREVRRHSALDAFLVHGPDRDRMWRAWQRRGGVAVTTFGTLPVLPPIPAPLPLVVVDEAHYLKNPATKRARSLLPIASGADRCLFLTGTPLENRLEEFQQLVSYLQPHVASQLSRVDGVASPRRYREALAPVYLRRNQQDVLQELPDLVVTEEWTALAASQLAPYRLAVASGNFMRMRRVAMTDEPQRSEKRARLLEIADEAAANGHKVIVFSYFRDVLEQVGAVLGNRVVGPLTGSVPAQERQGIVERFGAAPQDAVLLSQITAGGTGMNMQAGSVVVICEPQVKPSLESQAIARAHRMGQLRGVQVHRLLTVDTVDQRMVEILAEKQRLFDEYARGSAVATSSPEAVDVSERKLAAEVIEREMERLAVSRAEQLAAQQAGAVPS